jgi:hypothetical protein
LLQPKADPFEADKSEADKPEAEEGKQYNF